MLKVQLKLYPSLCLYRIRKEEISVLTLVSVSVLVFIYFEHVYISTKNIYFLHVVILFINFFMIFVLWILFNNLTTICLGVSSFGSVLFGAC